MCQGLTWWGLVFGLFLLASFSSPAVIGMLLLAAVNAAAYKMIKADMRTGIIPTVFGGIIGAYIAVKNENTGYFAAGVIKTFIRLCIWSAYMRRFRGHCTCSDGMSWILAGSERLGVL